MFFVFLLCIVSFEYLLAQDYPVFGPEIKVHIEGLAFDAMEPFISLDENTLYFNSLNAGGNTNLYYASRINDSTFSFNGLLGGTYDDSPDHLDGVASLDSLNNFFWVSLRNYPLDFENLHRGIYASGNVSNISRVYGDFNIYSPGWLIMDAAIGYHGDFLYYCNAFFNNCDFGIPCDASLGIAERINDTTFNKLDNSESILANVNDPNYIVYASQVSKDGLELYFTRILKNTVNSEICVSVRNSISEVFSVADVIHSNFGFIPEAASLTTDKQKLYYHQRDDTEVFHIYLRYRLSTTEVKPAEYVGKLRMYPNPASNLMYIQLPDMSKPFQVQVYSMYGVELLSVSNAASIDISSLANGMYVLSAVQDDVRYTARIIKE